MNFYATLRNCSLVLAIVCAFSAFHYIGSKEWGYAIYYVILTAFNHGAYLHYKRKSNEQR